MKRVLRAGFYTLGMLSLAFGIALSGKTGLGLSPIASMAFCVSEITGLNYGDMTFAMYALFVAAQFALRGRNGRAIDLLQLPISLVFSRVLNLFVALIEYDHAAHGFAADFALLAAAMIFNGFGVSVAVNMKLLPNPGEGIVQALAERTGWEQGLAKNAVDISCACVSITLGLVFAGKLVGVGIGTVAAMVCVGRVVALVNRLLKKNVYAPLTA